MNTNLERAGVYLVGLRKEKVEPGCCIISRSWGLLRIADPDITFQRQSADFTAPEEAIAYLSILPERRRPLFLAFPTRVALAGAVLGDFKPKLEWRKLELDDDGLKPVPTPVPTNTEQFLDEYRKRMALLKFLQISAAQKYLSFNENPDILFSHLQEFTGWAQGNYPDSPPDQIASFMRRDTTPFDIKHPLDPEGRGQLRFYPGVKIDTIVSPEEEKEEREVKDYSAEILKDLTDFEHLAARSRFILQGDKSDFKYRTNEERAEAIRNGEVGNIERNRVRYQSVRTIMSELDEADELLAMKLKKGILEYDIAPRRVKALVSELRGDDFFGRFMDNYMVVMKIAIGSITMQELLGMDPAKQ